MVGGLPLTDALPCYPAGDFCFYGNYWTEAGQPAGTFRFNEDDWEPIKGKALIMGGDWGDVATTPAAIRAVVIWD